MSRSYQIVSYHIRSDNISDQVRSDHIRYPGKSKHARTQHAQQSLTVSRQTSSHSSGACKKKQTQPGQPPPPPPPDPPDHQPQHRTKLHHSSLPTTEGGEKDDNTSLCRTYHRAPARAGHSPTPAPRTALHAWCNQSMLARSVKNPTSSVPELQG